MSGGHITKSAPGGPEIVATKSAEFQNGAMESKEPDYNFNTEQDFKIIEDYMNKIRDEECKKALETDVIPYEQLNNEQLFVPAKKQKLENFNLHQQSLNYSEKISQSDLSSAELNAAENCLICESTDRKGSILQCSYCQLKYHSGCVNITEDLSSTIIKFFCNFCIMKNSSLQTTYKNGKEPTYCVCKSSDEDRFMIGCDNCDNWFHGDCIKLSEMRASVIEKFYCKPCKNKDPNLEIIYKNDGFLTGAISFEYVKENDSENSRSNKRKSFKITYKP